MIDFPWQDCTIPENLLWYVRDAASDRQLRLFACGCCRAIWPLLQADAPRRAVDISERYADQCATAAELRAAEEASRNAQSLGYWLENWTTAEAAGPDPWHAALWTPSLTAEAAAEAAARAALKADPAAAAEQVASDAWHAERQLQCLVLRDICGNLWEKVRMRPDWLLWENGRLAKEAHAIYEEGQFHEVPAFARLLERAGCDDAAILAHCRGPHVHFRGCWVVDLLRAPQTSRRTEVISGRRWAPLTFKPARLQTPSRRERWSASARTQAA